MIEEYVNYGVYVLCVFILIYFLGNRIMCLLIGHKEVSVSKPIEQNKFRVLWLTTTKCSRCKTYISKELSITINEP